MTAAARMGTGCGCDCGGTAAVALDDAQNCTLHRIDDDGTFGVKDTQVPHCWGADLPDMFGNDVLIVSETESGTEAPYVYASGSCVAKWTFDLQPVWNVSPGGECYQIAESGNYIWVVHCRSEEGSNCRFYVSRFSKADGATGPTVECPAALQMANLFSVIQRLHFHLLGSYIPESVSGSGAYADYFPAIASSRDGGFYLSATVGANYQKGCGSIWKYDQNGSPTHTCDSVLFPRSIASDEFGNLFVAAYPVPDSDLPATPGTSGDEKYTFGPPKTHDGDNFSGAWKTQLCRCGASPANLWRRISAMPETDSDCVLGYSDLDPEYCGDVNLNDLLNNNPKLACQPPIPYDKLYTLYKLDTELQVSWKTIQYEYQRVFYSGGRLFAWANSQTTFFSGGGSSCDGTLFEINPSNGSVISKIVLRAANNSAGTSYYGYGVTDVAADDDDVYILIGGAITKLESDLSGIVWENGGNKSGVGSPFSTNAFYFSAIDFAPDSGASTYFPYFSGYDKKVFATSWNAVPCNQALPTLKVQSAVSAAEECLGYDCNPGAADFDYQAVGDTPKVFSLTCPCDSIACEFTKTAVGNGCFAPITGYVATFRRVQARYDGHSLISHTWCALIPFPCTHNAATYNDPVWIRVCTTETSTGWRSEASTVRSNSFQASDSPQERADWANLGSNCYNPCSFGPTLPYQLDETCSDPETGSPWANGLFRPNMLSCDCCGNDPNDTFGFEAETVDLCGCTGIPTTLTATFTNVSCDASWTGVTATLAYDGGSGFTFSGAINGKDVAFYFTCLGGTTWHIGSGTGPECALADTAESSSTCSPFQVNFTNVPISTIFGAGCGCVSGLVNVSVTA